MSTLTFITSSSLKCKEIQDIIGTEFKIVPENIEGLIEIQGIEREVACDKINRAYSILKKPIITEDTSLSFDALGGMPGPYIKSFLSSIGCIGLYSMLIGFTDKRATATCIIGFHSPKLDKPIMFEGSCKGHIVTPKGNRKFGYDPIFQPIGETLTYDEMIIQRKLKISERSQAVRKLKEYLLEHRDLL